MIVEIQGGQGAECLHLVEPPGPMRWSGLAFIAAAAIGGWASEVGWHVWAACAVAAAGTAVILYAARYEISADSRHQLVRLERRSLMTTQAVSLPFSAVMSIEFVTSTNRISDGATTYLIRIRRAKGAPIQASASVSWGREEKYRAAEQLARAIDVPLVEVVID